MQPTFDKVLLQHRHAVHHSALAYNNSTDHCNSLNILIICTLISIWKHCLKILIIIFDVCIMHLIHFMPAAFLTSVLTPTFKVYKKMNCDFIFVYVINVYELQSIDTVWGWYNIKHHCLFLQENNKHFCFTTIFIIKILRFHY